MAEEIAKITSFSAKNPFDKLFGEDHEDDSNSPHNKMSDDLAKDDMSSDPDSPELEQMQSSKITGSTMMMHMKKIKQHKSHLIYDEDAVPPDIEIAKNHQKCLRVSTPTKPNPELRKNMAQMCKCCSRYINKDYLDINCELKEMSFMGPGYPLYLVFLKGCIF